MTPRRESCSEPASHGARYESHREGRQHGDLKPWAIFVAATVALVLYFFGDRIGLDRQRLDLHFLVDGTFLMIFVIEHTQSRETAALHTKLDAIVSALNADTSTVGIEGAFTKADPGDPRSPSRADAGGAG